MSSSPWLTVPRSSLRRTTPPPLVPLHPRRQPSSLDSHAPKARFPEARRNELICRSYLPTLRCSSHGDTDVSSKPQDSQHSLSDLQGAGDGSDDKKEPFFAKGILKKLGRYGIAGVLSYGLLNTAYYLTTFLFVWLYVAPAPGKMGYGAAVKRFLKIMAMVWAGSQVTKPAKAGGALALAPFVDRGLSWFTAKFGFQSQEKASLTISGFCLALVLVFFLVVTLLWA